MALRIRPLVVHGYLFSTCGREKNSLIWRALRERFKSTPGSRWRQVFALGRFDFAVLRLAEKLYGSDLLLLKDGFVLGTEDVVECAWYLWDVTNDEHTRAELMHQQETEWRGLWDIELPILALMFLVPNPQWIGAKVTPKELALQR